MKQFSILIVFLFSIIYCNAQLKAVTSNGDEVILNENGTWKYVNDSLLTKSAKAADTNKIHFSKSPAASFLVKSNKTGYGVYIDPKKWGFNKNNDDTEPSEFALSFKKGDLYGMLITEKIEIPLSSLKSIALQNALKASPDIKVTNEEYRYVNNNLLYFMQMSGTIQGIKFTYNGYYFSSEKGTIQLLTYTSTNLNKEFKSDIEELLNGFVIL